MRIEILYFAGCPHHAAAIGRVWEALQREDATADVVQVEMSGAVDFPGSPTIRVNGRDVETAECAAVPSGLACRTYTDRGRTTGVPPLDWIRSAIRQARLAEESADATR